jgi:hypothetical protein
MTAPPRRIWRPQAWLSSAQSRAFARHIRQPKILRKGAILSQPLVALSMREEPDADVGDVLTAVPPPPTDGLDGGGPALHRHLAGHRHHHGARRPPMPGAATPCRHGCNPIDTPEPRGPTNMPGEAAHSSRGITPERRPNPHPRCHRSPAARIPPLRRRIQTRPCAAAVYRGAAARGERPRRCHPHPGFARRSLSAVARRRRRAGEPAGDVI